MEILNSITKYLSRFESNVKIAAANSEYDIAHHAENVAIPLFDNIFDTSFKNANVTEKNAKAIDLISEEKNIYVQVTVTKDIDKVKSTLKKFIESQYFTSEASVYIYMITGKQKSYSQAAINNVTLGKLSIDASTNIIDNAGVYKLIKDKNSLELYLRVADFLKSQFSDLPQPANNSFDIPNFVATYSQSCLNNFSRINFFGLSVSRKPREVELFQLFVQPIFKKNDPETNRSIWDNFFTDSTRTQFLPVNLFHDSDYNFDSYDKIELYHQFARTRWSHDQLNDQITFKQLFSNGGKNQHTVILGKPGAGKSSLIKYAICKLLMKDYQIFSNKDIYNYIPFRVELHKYNQFKKQNRSGFLDFLSHILTTEFQVTLSSEKMKYLYEHEKCIFMFDGMDEIFDVQERIDARNEIENFVLNRSNIRAVVTSRFESYEEVQLNSQQFTKIEVLDFNNQQLEDYVQKWYTLEETNPTIRKEEVNRCLSQLSGVSTELKQNPLLLSLILILYRNELEIPTSKLDIYESCTKTIVETRDKKEKKLGITLKISNIQSVFSSLAYWQFMNEIKNKLLFLTYTNARNHICEYLLEKREIKDREEAVTAAEEFLEFAKTRSIYFENYFTHKTFLEYFTAYYIFTNYHSKPQYLHKRDAVIAENISTSTWSVVLELLVCMIDKNQPDFEVIDGILITQVEINRNPAIVFFLQIIRYLQNVSPDTKTSLIEKAIKSCLDFDLNNVKPDADRQLIFNLLSDLIFDEKFCNIITSSFEILAKTENIEKLYIFAMEFGIKTGQTSLIEILKSMQLSEPTHPYNFLLINYFSIFNDEKYYDLFKEFKSVYGSERIAKTYVSPFSQAIFYGSINFHWISSKLSTQKTVTHFRQAYNKFKSLNVHASVMSGAAKRKVNTPSLSKTEFMQLLKVTKEGSLKSFLKQLIGTYFEPYHEKPQSEKFYDKFYKTQKSKK